MVAVKMGSKVKEPMCQHMGFVLKSGTPGIVVLLLDSLQTNRTMLPHATPGGKKGGAHVARHGNQKSCQKLARQDAGEIMKLAPRVLGGRGTSLFLPPPPPVWSCFVDLNVPFFLRPIHLFCLFVFNPSLLTPL